MINDSIKENDKKKDNQLIIQEFSKKSKNVYNLNDQVFLNENSVFENEKDCSGKFSQIIKELTLLDNSQRQNFCEMLERFQLLFSDKPGCAKVMNIN